MAKKSSVTVTALLHIPKGTSIGNGKLKMSSMNKHKKKSFKKYRGQGK